MKEQITNSILKEKLLNSSPPQRLNPECLCPCLVADFSVTSKPGPLAQLATPFVNLQIRFTCQVSLSYPEINNKAFGQTS